MNDFAHFIGFFAAHTVWQLEGGENVLPLVVTQKAGDGWLERIEDEISYEQAVVTAREHLQALLLQPDNDYILLAYDGVLTWENEKKQALFIEAINVQESHELAFHMAIPYRSARNNNLVIYQPKIIKIIYSDSKTFLEKFYEGVSNHTRASEFWMTHRENLS